MHEIPQLKMTLASFHSFSKTAAAFCKSSRISKFLANKYFPRWKKADVVSQSAKACKNRIFCWRFGNTVFKLLEKNTYCAFGWFSKINSRSVGKSAVNKTKTFTSSVTTTMFSDCKLIAVSIINLSASASSWQENIFSYYIYKATLIFDIH